MIHVHLIWRQIQFKTTIIFLEMDLNGRARFYILSLESSSAHGWKWPLINNSVVPILLWNNWCKKRIQKREYGIHLFFLSPDFSHAVAIWSAEGCEKESRQVHCQKACIQAFHTGASKTNDYYKPDTSSWIIETEGCTSNFCRLGEEQVQRDGPGFHLQVGGVGGEAFAG